MVKPGLAMAGSPVMNIIQLYPECHSLCKKLSDISFLCIMLCIPVTVVSLRSLYW
jgi:hypothetical protein